MSVYAITKENFHQEVLNAEQPVLLDFWASWCGPCKMLSPVVDEIALEHPEIKVGKINVQEQRALASEFHIMGIPTLMVFKGGKPVGTAVGVQSKVAIEAMVK